MKIFFDEHCVGAASAPPRYWTDPDAKLPDPVGAPMGGSLWSSAARTGIKLSRYGSIEFCISLTKSSGSKVGVGTTSTGIRVGRTRIA